MSDLVQQAAVLRCLHHGSEPLLLPNAWDVASARTVRDAEFPVIATSSHAVAATLGMPDEDVMDPDLALAVIARISTSVNILVTADLERGINCRRVTSSIVFSRPGLLAAIWRTPTTTAPSSSCPSRGRWISSVHAEVIGATDGA